MDKAILENIDIDQAIPENIDIDINKDILENNDIDIDKDILGRDSIFFSSCQIFLSFLINIEIDCRYIAIFEISMIYQDFF